MDKRDDQTDATRPHIALRETVSILEKKIEAATKVSRDIISDYYALEKIAKQNAVSARRFLDSISMMELDEQFSSRLMQTMYIGNINIENRYVNSLSACTESIQPLEDWLETVIPVIFQMKSQFNLALKAFEQNNDKFRARKKQNNDISKVLKVFFFYLFLFLIFSDRS